MLPAHAGTRLAKVQVEVKVRVGLYDKIHNETIFIKAAMEKEKQLLTISEVSKQLNVPKHTLRFWEKEFKGLVAPRRTQGRQRRFGVEDISRIKEIKRMRDRGMSLSEIKRALGNGQSIKPQEISQIDILANRVAEVVRTEVYEFFQRGLKNG